MVPNTPFPEIPISASEQNKQNAELIAATLQVGESTARTTWLQRQIRGWHKLTSVPDVPAESSFYKREFVRKSRLLSTVLFYFSIVIFVFLPCCTFLPNPNITYVDGALLLASFVAMYLNRQGQLLAAALTTVIGFEAALTIAIFMITPLDESSIQLYDLYIMGLLLAVSLLPVRNVFIFALANSMIVLISLTIQQHTAGFNHDLQTQFIPVMIRPIALQFITAGVSYVWVSSTTTAIARADRAEMVASLERALSLQKHQLEEGVEQILQTHVAVANGNLNARAPLNQDNALWQIARALNTLLVRLQRAVQAERDLYRVEQAIASSVNAIQEAEKLQLMPRISLTQTAIDPLIAVLQGKTIAIADARTNRANMQQRTRPATQMPPTPTPTPTPTPAPTPMNTPLSKETRASQVYRQTNSFLQ